MSYPTAEILDVARRAARAAARVCLGVLAASPDSPEAMAKLGKEPVTLADYGSQAVVLEAIATAFPDHLVVAEEGSAHLRQNIGDEGAARLSDLVGESLGRPVSFEEVATWIDHSGRPGGEWTWAIDPIDGTKGFLRRQQFAVAVGVLRDDEPYVGVLACPHMPHDERDPASLLYWAAPGHGSWVEPIVGGAAQPVRVSDVDDPARVSVLGSVESAHGDPALVRAVVERAGFGGSMVRLDSQVKYGAVASGLAELYLRPRNHRDYRERIWDHAAGVAIVREAGGHVTDLDGKSLDFGRGSRLEGNRGVVATNGLIHDRVLDAVARSETG